MVRLQTSGCRANKIKQVRPMNLIPVQLQAPGSNRATGLMKASLTTSQPARSGVRLQDPDLRIQDSSKVYFGMNENTET